MSKRIAVIIYGPPGSGKGTQSELIANAYRIIHFDTGRRIREVIYDPANRDDNVIAREREYYEKGLLCDEWWVFKIVTEGLREISKGSGIVLSGSPRTVYEAFDEGDRRAILSLLADAYGREHIHIFLLKVSPESSAFRNGKRKICPVCARGYLFTKECDLTACPFCQSPLNVRTDDDPAIMHDRLLEFEKRTTPIFEGLKERGYVIHEINGELPPYLVFKEITRWLP